MEGLEVAHAVSSVHSNPSQGFGMALMLGF